MLRAARSRVLLGRPISVFGYSGGILSFVIAERGEGTRELALLCDGEELLLEGPLGSGWPARPALAGRETIGAPDGVPIVEAWTQDRPEKPVALVGGGIGLAPLAFLAGTLPPNSYDLHAGFRTGSWGLEGLHPRYAIVSTEDGSVGRRGRVLEGLEAARYSAIYGCGPEPMLVALAGIARAAGVPAWLSLERRMACGVGACLGCTVRTVKGNRRACVEGPIFDAEELLFDE
jgi:NAD(P)H-flavin reductase